MPNNSETNEFYVEVNVPVYADVIRHVGQNTEISSHHRLDEVERNIREDFNLNYYNVSSVSQGVMYTRNLRGAWSNRRNQASRKKILEEYDVLCGNILKVAVEIESNEERMQLIRQLEKTITQLKKEVYYRI